MKEAGAGVGCSKWENGGPRDRIESNGMWAQNLFPQIEIIEICAHRYDYGRLSRAGCAIPRTRYTCL
jgi:hypothetical protein